jgi:N-lysine methyltransferase SETD6
MDPDDMEDSFVLERTSADPDASGQVPGYAVFDGLPEELAAQVKAFLMAAAKVDGTGRVADVVSDKSKRQEVYQDSVLKALKDREAQYVTTLEDDQKIQESGETVGRKGLALYVRMGEKALLREAQDWVQKELEKLRARDGKPPSKRQKTTRR